MSSAPTQQGFPATNLPFVDTTGMITQNWYQFLVSLWNRTGGAAGSQTFVTGDIKISASSTPQDGWVPCDGSTLDRTTYRGLFNVIGSAWGNGDGSTTFNVPNFNGAAPIGGTDIGSTGGSTTVTLGIANLASHNHPIIDPGHVHVVTDPGHTHALNDPGHDHAYDAAVFDAVGGGGANSVADNSTGATTDSAATNITVLSHVTNVTIANNTTGVTTSNVGSATPFSVQNPFGVVNYMIKT